MYIFSVFSVLYAYHSARQQWEQQWSVSVCHMKVRCFPGPTQEQQQLKLYFRCAQTFFSVCSSSSFLCAVHCTTSGGEYLVQQAKFGVLLLGVFTAGVRVFLHQEDISLFTLENKQNYYYIITVTMPCYFDPCGDFLHKVIKSWGKDSKQHLLKYNITIVFTMLLGQVSFPGL